ncbi:MAG: FkbM family methyltransferase [Planctomycetota bacterium]|nr:FkbM family methyltransferase [Planctomycetota bacterium]
MKHLRTLVERMSRGRSFWRRLPAPFAAARVLVTPDAALSYLKPGDAWCDPELLRVVSQCVKAGDTVWDIGANVGVFGAAAAVAAGANGSVLCIEPDLVLAQLIRKTASKLPPGCARLEVLATAVAERPGVAAFNVAERGRASNALEEFAGVRSQGGSVRERQLVPVVSMDDLLGVSASPAVVKIDVEGAESVIFKGAARVLREVRPLIYVEVGDGQRAVVTQQLRDASYELFDPSKPLEGQSPLPECRWNTLAIPKGTRGESARK